MHSTTDTQLAATGLPRTRFSHTTQLATFSRPPTRVQATGDVMNLVQLVTTPIALAVGARGYLEARTARKELSEKKKELRKQAAEFSRKLAEQRQSLEFADRQGTAKKVLAAAGNLPDAVPRRILFPAAAAGILATGVKLGTVISGTQENELGKLRKRLSETQAQTKEALTGQAAAKVALDDARKETERFKLQAQGLS
eukprot:2162-Amorphochlora_amoeboformis.AAC.1